jgi:hypothetical protein
MMNTGTLVSAAIRPNSSLDPIASAYAVEIKGGLHTTNNLINRDAIIFERREWGMLCYVESEDTTYQLRYNYVSSNIMNNNNWVVFAGSGSGSGGEWLDSVLLLLYNEPLSPSNGDRYLVGLAPGDSISGTNWSLINPGVVVQWDSVLNQWIQTDPTDGMSVRVDNQDNIIYKYEGDFPSGSWGRENLNQVRSINAVSSNGGLTYNSVSSPLFPEYFEDMVLLVNFSEINSIGTASLNINSLGDINIIKASSQGLEMLSPLDIKPDIVYTLVYDGVNFQLTKPSNEDLFNVKYYVEPNDYIVVPSNHQYWVYGDLTIDGGTIMNQGQVIIANGDLNLTNGGVIQNIGTYPNGQLIFANFNGGVTPSFVNSDTIQFTQSNSPGLVVSADIIDGSLTASKLNTNTEGATAGYILSVNTDGTFKWIEATSEVGSTNGLSDYSGEIGLGGTLSQMTVIDADGNDLFFNNLENLVITASSSFDVNVEDGLIVLDAGDLGSVDIYGGDVTIIGTNSFNIAAGSGDVTIENGEGLVYTDDYSATFVTHSLVDKNYVDNLVNLNTNNLSYQDKNFLVQSVVTGNSQFTGLTVSGQPILVSYIQVYINGLEYPVGGLSDPFYFSDDGGVTPKTNVETGDGLYYNESLGFGSIEIGFRISLNYLE